MMHQCRRLDQNCAPQTGFACHAAAAGKRLRAAARRATIGDMREVTLTFVRHFANSDPALMRDAREVLGKFTGIWRNSAGAPLPDRYAVMHAAVDSEIAAIKSRLPRPVPCTKGCNHCCKFNRILPTPHEAVLLVQHIEGLSEPEKAALLARISASTSQSGGGEASPCALLDARGCSVYTARPLPCRGFYSTSEPACNSRLNGGPDPPNIAATRMVELAAMDVAAAGKHPPYEVNTLLRRIYSDPAKVGSWAAGRPTEERDLAVTVTR
jgi:Fe-S-cluster containining protein